MGERAKSCSKAKYCSYWNCQRARADEQLLDSITEEVDYEAQVLAEQKKQ